MAGMSERARTVRAGEAQPEASTAPAPRAAPSRAPRIERPRDCLATGVSAGLAAHLGWPVPLVRAAFVVTSLVAGAGLLLYLWLWALTPWQAGEETPKRRAPVAWLLLAAGAVLLAAGWVLGRRLDAQFDEGAGDWVLAMLAGVVCVVGAGAWASFFDRPDPARGPRHELAIRAAATALLAFTVLSLMLGATVFSFPLPTFALALAAALGIALLFVPTLVTRWRELGEERTRRIREEQRGEIAAHLHDSVLQTLALIQNRAGATSEVARIARAQERELRDWLYAGDAPADSDLGTDLRDFGALLEIDHPVTVDVVVVGEQRERASGELAAAAREAMLNAARHAGGEISVYVESRPDAVEVFVRDRGPGFSLDEVPGDRLGVRQSIIARMRRAGGEAAVGPGAGGVGTQIRLRFPATQQAPGPEQPGRAGGTA
jgi:signal transduction histidine kinase